MSSVNEHLDTLFGPQEEVVNTFEELKTTIPDKTVISNATDLSIINPTEGAEVNPISSINSMRTVIGESDSLISTHNSEEALPNESPISTQNALDMHETTYEEELISSHNSERLVDKVD